ncbi:MAG TPA: hypothetical protein VJ801_07270 [Polyangia bacterium]|nr:hypothetical protein [Polyangia bacterium]
MSSEGGSLQLQPLPAESLSPAVAGLVGGATPAKLMAVRGMAAVRPAELLVAIYQLSFDAEPAVRAAAEAAPAGLPDNVIGPPLGEALPASLLHFFAIRLPDTRAAALEKILYNPATADQTFVTLAARLNESLLEIIFQNEVRLLRCPAIVQALFFNKRARMSSVNRAVELCARNGVRVEGIPAFDEFVSAIRQDPEALDGTVVDGRFQAALTAAEAAPVGDQESGQGDELFDEEMAPEEKDRAVNMSFIKFDELRVFEKIRLATIGNAYCRKVLVRDANKLVAMTVIRSPQLTDMEIRQIAGSTNVCDDVIRYIANNRECSKDYPVKLALVSNPKCPLGSSLRFLAYLHQEDLRNISRSRNVPGVLSTAAKKLLQQREGGRH